MIETIKNKFPNGISQITPYRRLRFEKLLSLLNNSTHVSGILLGGSLSYKDNFEKSDIDLFCLIDNVLTFESNLQITLSELNDVDEIIYQGVFPWTERLYTIYFREDIDFSIDLCLIGVEKSETFFWEPNGYILLDRENSIEACRKKQMGKIDFTLHPFLKSNPFTLSIITLKKIEKNLSRNHLWNALEQVNTFRRYILQIIRLNGIGQDYFLGSVVRDIEDVIPDSLNVILSKTLAAYDLKDIAQKTILLIDIFESLQHHLKNGIENKYYIWIDKQVKHELIKLQNYL